MFTGVDYAGPLQIREGKSIQKVWICLFTCAVIRAVHLDVVHNLSSKSFIRCLKRFWTPKHDYFRQQNYIQRSFKDDEADNEGTRSARLPHGYEN